MMTDIGCAPGRIDIGRRLDALPVGKVHRKMLRDREAAKAVG